MVSSELCSKNLKVGNTSQGSRKRVKVLRVLEVTYETRSPVFDNDVKTEKMMNVEIEAKPKHLSLFNVFGA